MLYRLVTNRSAIRHEIICLHKRDWYSPRLEERGVVVHHLNITSPISGVTGIWKLNSLIRRSGADVVQCWMYRSNLLAGLLARFAGLPVVWNIRCSSLAPLKLGSRLLAYAGGALARWVPDVILNCSAQSAELHARIGYGSAEGIVIPNGYDPTLFYPDEPARAAARAALRAPPETFLVGSIGRWHPQKGYPVLLKALRLLHDRGVPLRLILAGRGLESGNSQLVKLIEDSGCEAFVELLGERSDVQDLARAMDLHVLASIGSEGFPNAVAETMLSGTPNVATDVGDSALIVGETGWIVPPGDVERLADSIGQAYSEWSASPGDWQRRRQSSRQRIVDNFSLERMARAYQAVWTKVASQPREAAAVAG